MMHRAILLLAPVLIACAMGNAFAMSEQSLATTPFPIAVWLQNPVLAPEYQQAGFNLYVGLWQGPTEAQLSAVKKAGMRVICEQNDIALKHLQDPTIFGWMQQDEPDNAQPLPQGEYGPCVPPEKVVDIYRKIHSNDPSRPSMLNLGQGVANDQWVGRGTGAKLSDYLTYVKGGDIISFDIYPIAQFGPSEGLKKMWLIAKGLERLKEWTAGKKPLWCCIECTNIDGNGMATPDEVRSEVWMAITHGAKGLIYFVHQFKPKFDEHALLDEPEMLKTVTKLNSEIQAMNPILQSPSSRRNVTVSTSNEGVPISMLVREYKGAIYLFAIGMRDGDTTATFHIPAPLSSTQLTVLNENRTIEVRQGTFQDSFTPYQVHIYRIDP